MGTGANTVLSLRVAMLKVLRRLVEKGLVEKETKLINFKVGNLLASYALAGRLQLQQLAALAAANNIQIDIDPERFPGARLKIPIQNHTHKQVNPKP